jgi:hypothetical protein
MHLPRKASRIVWTIVFGRLILSYLDPGTGSFIIQLLIGGLLSSLFLVKIFWKRITGILKRSDKSAAEPSQEQSVTSIEMEDQRK